MLKNSNQNSCLPCVSLLLGFEQPSPEIPCLGLAKAIH